MQALNDHIHMALAVSEAERFVGATAPNPPVGAYLVSVDGRMLAVGAHERAGAEHAEAQAIRRAFELFGPAALRGATLYVTLEPCNHQGRTPPCTDAILSAGIKRVVYGVRDPNKKVEGGGVEHLQVNGVSVESAAQTGAGELSCLELIRPFQKWTTTGLPWVVHKQAWRLERDTDGSSRPTMLPQAGARTFTTPESLVLAHLERRKSDAIITGMGTVLADEPLYTVRRMADHPGKKRFLAVLSARKRAFPERWVERQRELGFEVLPFSDLNEALQELGRLGAQRVLVEAGPALSESLAQEKLWDERLTFVHDGEHDRIFRDYR